MLFAARKLARRPFWRDLDVELEAGDLLVVRGDSGSGKSLLLRALADLDPLEQGELYLHDEPSESYRPAEWRRRVLYMEQGAPVLPGTVNEDLAWVASLHGLAHAASIGLDGSASTGRLSGGERQRLALERALLCGPDVLLLDEASSGLDQAAALRFEARVLEFARAGRAVLWVSHAAGLAERLGAEELWIA